MDRVHALVEQASATQLTKQRGNASRTVHIFHVVGAAVGDVRGDLREAGNAPRDSIDLVETEGNPGLVRRCEQVQNGVR